MLMMLMLFSNFAHAASLDDCSVSLAMAKASGYTVLWKDEDVLSKDASKTFSFPVVKDKSYYAFACGNSRAIDIDLFVFKWGIKKQKVLTIVEDVKADPRPIVWFSQSKDIHLGLQITMTRSRGDAEYTVYVVEK